MNNLYTVQEASIQIGVSSDTIRRWEKKGLIKARRSNNNHRLFDIQEIVRINNKVSGSDSAKNNYRILKDAERSDYTALELFAGSGGTALGFDHAGINHELLTDWDKDSCNTLRSNRPDWNVKHIDVRELNFKKIDVDIVEGGFPCQAFSYAGNRKGFDDIRGTMFFEFARSIKEIKPKVIMGENVKGLLRHDEGRTMKTISKTLQELGYKIAYKILRAQYLDVPQKRERVIIIGVRSDLDLPILFPIERDYTISLREALANCPISEGQQYPDRKKKVLDMVPPGGYWRDLPVAIQKEYMMSSYHLGGGKTGMARRLSWNEPSLTLTCAPAQKQTERCHPGQTRPLTVREYARIQTFPDDWQFSGPMTSKYKQIGNAVPVNLGYHIGKCLRAMLDGDTRKKGGMELVAPMDRL